MAVWPGEKLGLYDGVVSAGDVDWFGLDVIESPGSLTTVAAGDQFYLYARSTTALIEGDQLGECNWLVDVAAGDATVVVETGYDAGWNYREPFGWAPSGVTHLVPGLLSVPLPAADRSYARLKVEGAPLLRFTVTAGRADLNGVWLQVEPPGGLKVPTGYALSDWVTPPMKAVPAKMATHIIQYGLPNQTYVKSPTYTYDGDYNQGDHLVGDVDLSPTFRDILNSVLGQVYGSGPIDNGWDQPGYAPFMRATAAWTQAQARSYNDRNATSPDGPGFDYNGQMQAIIFTEAKAIWEDVTTVRSTDGLPGLLGRDYVRNEEGATVEYAGDSTSVGWQPGHILPYGANVENHTNRLRGTVLDAEHPSPHGEFYRLTGTFLQVVDGASLPANPNAAGNGPPSWAQSQTSGATLVSPAPGFDIVMSARHDLKQFRQPATAPWGTGFERENDWVNAAESQVTWFWTELADGRFYSSSPRLMVQPPAFRYYVPVYDTRKPRFYVTYTEVDEHPVDVSHVVGIGKPADDLSIFRVPTPLGTFRELRHGEKVTDVSVAYPLKVKLEDGSWTVVAGMTPDD